MASGADDSLVIIWAMKMVPKTFGDEEEEVRWGNPRQLRGHVGDVTDLTWTKDSTHMISCSIDNTTILWSMLNGKF